MNIKRGEPKRRIDKLEAARHMVHSSIRLFFAQDDPFAVHVLAQSADKLLAEYFEAKDLKSNFAFDDLIPSGSLRSFMRVYRETFNFFKHADKDADELLGIHDICAMNEIVIFLNCTKCNEIDISTKHMRLFLIYYVLKNPDSIYPSALQKMALNYRYLFRMSSTGEFLSTVNEALQIDQEVILERRHDNGDAVLFAQGAWHQASI